MDAIGSIMGLAITRKHKKYREFQHDIVHSWLKNEVAWMDLARPHQYLMSIAPTNTSMEEVDLALLRFMKLVGGIFERPEYQ